MASTDTDTSFLGAVRMGIDPNMSAALAQNWWAFLVRGILGVVFAIIAFSQPGVTILSLVLVFAAYAIIDGVMSITAAVRAIQHHERWALLVLEGLVDILIAIIAIVAPPVTVVAFVYLLAIWAIMTGVLMLAAAFTLHLDHGRWWLGFGGVISIVYGVLLFLSPLIGALVLTFWLGAYALIFGISMIVLAFRLKGQHSSSGSSTTATAH